MSQTGWTPVDEKATQGWTPVQQAPAAQDVQAAQQNKASGAQPSTLGTVAREGALGLAGGLGIPETQTPIKDLAKGLGKQAISGAVAATNPPQMLYNAYQQGKGLVEQGVGAVKEAYQGYKQKDPGAMAHGAGTITGMALQALMMKKGAEGKAPIDALAEDAKNFDPHIQTLDNAWRFGGHKLLQDAMTKVKAQVGQYAKQIIDADNAANQTRGGLGSHTAVDAYKILDDSIKQRNPAEMPRSAEAQKLLMDITGGLQDWQTMQKYRTEVGKLWREASKRAENTGEGRADAAATRSAYQSLTDQMQQGASRVGHTDTFKEYNKLNTQHEKAMQGPIGEALDEDPSPLRDRTSNGYKFWGNLFSVRDQAQLHESLADLQKGKYIDPAFTELRNTLRPVMSAIDEKGKINFKQRLAVAGLFSALGIPHPFLSAYTAMYFPEIAKMMKGAKVERMIGNSLPQSLPEGDWFSPPKQSGAAPAPQAPAGAPQAPPSQAAGNMPAQPRGSAVATGDASLFSNPQVMKALVERLVDARMSRGIRDSYTKAQEGMGVNPKGKPSIESVPEAPARPAKAEAVQGAQKSKSNIPDIGNPIPQRSARVSRGAHGQVKVEFPDENHKDLFSAPGRLRRQSMGEGGIKADLDGLAARMGVSKQEIVKMAYDYKERIMKAVKDREEGSTYVAPKAKGEVE